MSNVISTRLKKKEIDELNKISENEHIDRSSLMRKFLINQMTLYKMGGAAAKYRIGLISLAEAATMAEVSIYQMMEYCQKENIRPVESTREEIVEEFDDAKEIFRNLDKN